MPRFIGRERELEQLRSERRAVTAEKGRMVAMRGRRRVGKSSLVQRFVSEAGAGPHVFFSAPRRTTRASALAQFAKAVAESDLPAAGLAEGVSFDSWDAALRFAAQQATVQQPLTIVIDELPYILEGDPRAGAELQHCWDKHLARLPVLVILIGSDVGIMERVTGHDGELFGRPSREPRVDPLTPGETAAMLGLANPADSIDAYLICGGFPVLAEDWPAETPAMTYLESQLRDDNGLLVMHGQRILDAEFDGQPQARAVLEAVGTGERTFTSIQHHLRVASATTLTRALGVLAAKKVVLPVERLDGKGWDRERRYYVSDAYLRFWLRFVGPNIDEIARGQGDRTLARIAQDFSAYRGKAVEPVVHEALLRIDGPWPPPAAVGGFWTRQNNPEVDIVMVDELPRPKAVTLAGSIKWREATAFSRSDTNALMADIAKIPGARRDATQLIGVSRHGFAAGHGLDVAISAAQILAATE